MRWKRFAYAGLLPPLLAGCHGTCFTARDLVHEHRAAHDEEAITRELRKDARCAWREVRSQFPRRMFSEEFREGFLDGYTDYLDRGGNASPPLVPPARYTRNKKYYTPEGQALLKDYLLGFKYGTDVAVATGCRQFLTVPVLLPIKEPCCAPGAASPVASEPVEPVVVNPSVTIDPRGANPVVFPPANPLPTPKPQPTAKTAPKPETQPIEVGQKFAVPVPRVNYGPVPDDLLLPPRIGEPGSAIPNLPDPPMPRSSAPVTDDVLPVSNVESKFVPRATPAEYRLPEPPVEVPMLPEGVPTPSVLDDLPVLKK